MKRKRSKKHQSRSLTDYGGRGFTDYDENEDGELWGVYCLSESGRWVLQGLRRSKDDAMKMLEKMIKNGKRCRVVLARL